MPIIRLFFIFLLSLYSVNAFADNLVLVRTAIEDYDRFPGLKLYAEEGVTWTSDRGKSITFALLDKPEVRYSLTVFGKKIAEYTVTGENFADLSSKEFRYSLKDKQILCVEIDENADLSHEKRIFARPAGDSSSVESPRVLIAELLKDRSKRYEVRVAQSGVYPQRVFRLKDGDFSCVTTQRDKYVSVMVDAQTLLSFERMKNNVFLRHNPMLCEEMILTVQDEDGLFGIENAVLSFNDEDYAGIASYNINTDGDGEAVVRLCGPKKLTVRAPGYLNAYVTVEPRELTESGHFEDEIYMSAGLTLSGKVIDASGRVVSNADLRIISESASGAKWDSDNDLARAFSPKFVTHLLSARSFWRPYLRTDDRGRFETRMIPEGKLTIVAHKNGIASQALIIAHPDDLNTTNLILKLEHAMTKTVRVVHRRGGGVRASIRVCVSGQCSSPKRTNGRGFAEISVTPMQSVLKVSAPGYYRKEIQASPEDVEEIVVDEIENITGQVQDSSGQAVKKAWIIAVSRGHLSGNPSCAARSDESGRFAIDDCDEVRDGIAIVTNDAYHFELAQDGKYILDEKQEQRHCFFDENDRRPISGLRFTLSDGKKLIAAQVEEHCLVYAEARSGVKNPTVTAVAENYLPLKVRLSELSGENFMAKSTIRIFYVIDEFSSPVSGALVESPWEKKESGDDGKVELSVPKEKNASVVISHCLYGEWRGNIATAGKYVRLEDKICGHCAEHHKKTGIESIKDGGALIIESAPSTSGLRRGDIVERCDKNCVITHVVRNFRRIEL